jgi:hypothetical protein
MFEKSDLDELVAKEARPAVSISMPTHVAGREVRQDPIRLKNLLGEAAARLEGSCRKPEIEALLAPARRLVEDDRFWRHQAPGLAIFLAPGFERVFRLPIAMPEEVLVDNNFRIRPLLPLAEDWGGFWLLAISGSRARLYRGSRWHLEEWPGLDLPDGVDFVAGESEYEETHHGPGPGRQNALAKSQPLGDAPPEARKAELIEFLHRVAAAVEPVVRQHPAPVILAAHPEINGNFRDTAGWDALEPEGIAANPDALGEQELHRRAAAIVAAKVEAARGEALERLHSLIGSGNGKATTIPQETVAAACQGRVDTLFAADIGNLWGRFDDATQRTLVHSAPAEGDSDLVNHAALMTLRHGGRVIAVGPAELPAPHSVAAILRY